MAQHQPLLYKQHFSGLTVETSQTWQRRLKAHFLAHQPVWAPSLIALWVLCNTLLLATTSLMEGRRNGGNLAWWEPFCWEISSVLLILPCIWLILRLHNWLLGRVSLLRLLLIHALLTLPFSLVHVTGMVAIREFCYWLAGWDYRFGDWGYELLYEYRKDVASYLIILSVVFAYQFIVRRLQGEASYLDENENSSRPLPDRLLVKKLGKEFLVAVVDIRWIEASGNYANLHVNGSVYPMRMTMARLETLLPAGQFVRVHRSAIVNVACVSHIQPTEAGDYRLFLHTGEELALSRRYRDGFKETFQPGEFAC